MKRERFHKTLSKPGLLHAVQNCFRKIDDTIKGRGFTLEDYLMSGLAVFSLKHPSLLAFDNAVRDDEKVRSNLKSLYRVSNTPSDSGLRKRLDSLDPATLRDPFKRLFSKLQRAKVLEQYKYLDGHCLLSLDGTGFFSSRCVHCKNCCEKHHRDGSVTYYHHMLCGAIVHPEHKEVFPFAPEQILKTDGAKKNDCERNAAKRFIEDLRREHPHLKLIVLEDGLASNAPHVRHLIENNLRYILGAKKGDHKKLFEDVGSNPNTKVVEIEDEQGVKHWFRFLNNVSLNASNADLKVNFVEYHETKPGTKKKPESKPTKFSWVTDIPLNRGNLMEIMRAGRSRWRIENETFNTLKNHGYHFEHNFGHGEENLSSVFGNLMLLAFLIDQIEMRCCKLFSAALEKVGRLTYLRERIRGIFVNMFVASWEVFYQSIAYGHSSELVPDTS